MRLIYGTVLLFIVLVIFFTAYRRTHDLFSPMCMFAIMQGIRYVPHIISTDYEHFAVLNDDSLTITFVIEVLFIIAVTLGYRKRVCFGRFGRDNGISNNDSISDRDIPMSIIIFIYIVGFAARISLIMSIGGFTYALHNMGQAYSLYSHTSSGYITALGNLMTLAEIMLVQKIAITNRRHHIILLGIMIVFGMATYLVYSSRSPALEMLMIVIFAYNYLIRRIKLKSILRPKILIIVASVVLIVAIMPSIRNESGNSSFDYESVDWGERVQEGLEGVFSEFSYVGRDTYVYHYFSVDNYWLGKNYLNLLVSFIPSSIYTNKPCVDDGNYLCNIMYGYQVSPNAGRDDLPIKYSIPFSTQGCTYANFGIIGVVFAGLLLGIIYRQTYDKFQKRITAFSVILYQLIVYQLELSTLSIIQTLIPLVFLGVTFVISDKLFGRKKYSVNYN